MRLLGIALIAATSVCQTPQEALDTKLGSPFLKRAPWILELENARAQARKTGRLILGYFTTTGP